MELVSFTIPQNLSQYMQKKYIGKIFDAKEVEHCCGHLKNNNPRYLIKKKEYCFLTYHVAAFFLVLFSYKSDM